MLPHGKGVNSYSIGGTLLVGDLRSRTSGLVPGRVGANAEIARLTSQVPSVWCDPSPRVVAREGGYAP